MKTTLTVDAEYLKILKDLTKEHEVETQQEFFNAMVLYFKETGINPKTKTKSTVEELSKLRNTLIGFIREQEKKKLDPMILKITEVLDFLRDYFKNEAVSKKDMMSLVQSLKQEDKQNTKYQDSGDERYTNLVNQAKGIFNELFKNFKSSTFGGYIIDKPVLEKYKKMIESL